jgi:phenylacetate-CoA ligase
MTTTTQATDLEALRARTAEQLNGRLPRHFARLDWDARRLAAHQRDRLRALLAHALQHSPFHARRLSGIDPDSFELADIPRLPVMTKDELMAGYDDVLTDRRLSRARVEEHLATSVQTPALLEGEYVCLASGGSSGRRGIFVQTVEEYAEFGSATLRRAMARIIAMGGPPPQGLRLAMIGAASPVHSTGFAAATAGGPMRLVSAPATLPLPDLVSRLNEIQPTALMGYPAKLAELARERTAGRLQIAPLAVTSTSELLTAADREAITAGFGVPVVNQFASTEGLVGHSEPGEVVQTFADDICLVELVDELGDPVPEGTPSAKALVTNLHNLTQPLIRYELTDRFVRHPSDAFLRATVQGRADEPFRYGDVKVAPHAIRSVMVRAPQVSEYAVRQTRRGVAVDVVTQAEVDRAALAAALREALRHAGLEAPDADVRAVAAIPRDPQTGKAKRFTALAA